jgi:hypothetical protein
VDGIRQNGLLDQGSNVEEIGIRFRDSGVRVIRTSPLNPLSLKRRGDLETRIYWLPVCFHPSPTLPSPLTGSPIAISPGHYQL